MSGSLIWNTTDDTSPTVITPAQWLAGTSEIRTIPANSTRIIQFTFEKTAEDTGYNATITLSNGCTRSANR
jgi:hypothetical protein